MGPSDGLRFGNSSSDSHSPGYSGSSNGAVGMSETSTVTTAPDTKCKEGSCKRMGRCTCLLGSQNVNKKNRKSAAMGRVSVNVGEKRQRKPPQRYIEESSKANSRSRQKKDGVVVKDKPPLWKEPKRKHTRLSVRILPPSLASICRHLFLRLLNGLLRILIGMLGI